MANPNLHIFERPTLQEPRMVIGLSGWMDGGEVSSGSIDYLVETFDAEMFADMDPDQFYVYSFPGPMEVSAALRPRARIEEGLVQDYDEPENTFYCSEEENLIFFAGREPNMKWRDYADCLFEVAHSFQVKRIAFVGSVAGLVPHTKAPLFYSSSTDESMRERIERLGLQPTNYEGPASFSTYLVERAKDAGIEMSTVVTGVPAYVEGRNVTCIEAAVTKVAALLDFQLDTTDLQEESREFIKGLDKVVARKPEFRDHVKKLEVAYEEQVTGADLDEVRDWFERQGMRFN